MKYLLNAIIVVFTALLFLGNTPPTEENKKVQWISFEEAVAKARVTPKKIFIDVYTDWCGWCKRMDANTFSHPDIAQYMNENFYCIKFDAEQKEDVVLGNQTFKFVPQGPKGYHQLAAALLQNKMSYPTVVFLDEGFNMITPVPGYRDPAGMDALLKYFAEDHYKDTDINKFLQEYSSPYNTK